MLTRREYFSVRRFDIRWCFKRVQNFIMFYADFPRKKIRVYMHIGRYVYMYNIQTACARGVIEFSILNIRAVTSNRLLIGKNFDG